MRTLMTMLMVATITLTSTRQVQAKPLRIAIFQGHGTVAVDEIIKTLEQEGMQAEALGRKTFDRICEFDAIFFGGGWNRFNWLTFDQRAKLVEYVENRGGGVIFSMFRCGAAARGLIRPIFPEIAYAYNKSNGSDIFIHKPDHPIALGLPEKYITPYWDHAILDVGLHGNVLAVNSNDDPTLVCGPAGKGRAVFIGLWIGLHGQFEGVKYPLPDTDKKLLLNAINWVTDVPHKELGGKCEVSDAILVKVLRREKIIDWTHNDAVVSWPAGILPQAMYPSEEKLDALVFRLERVTPFTETAVESRTLLDLRNRVAVTLDALRTEYEQALENKEREIGALTLEELQETPVRDFANRAACPEIEQWRESLCPSHVLDSLEEGVAQLERELQLDMRMEKTLARQRKADRRRVREYVSWAESDDLAVRRRGIEELARIGGNKAARALLGAIHDEDQKVRLTAVKGLAWMQASSAVKPLINIVVNVKDRWMRRRAVQALGQIGRGQAFDTLVAALGDEDVFVRRNAILALGWMGKREACEYLLKVLDNPLLSDKTDEDGRKPVREHAYVTGTNLKYSCADITCAIRALGHLGCKRAVAPVDEFFRTHRLGSGTIPNHYLLQSFKTNIAAGGRKMAGVEQAEIFANRGYCYPFGSRYSGLYGRYDIWGDAPRDKRVWADYATGIGGTGHINFTRAHEFYVQPDQDNAKKLAKWKRGYEGRGWGALYDIRDYFDQVDFKQYFEIPNTGHMVFDLAAMEDTLLNWGQQHPSFAGYWREESFHYSSTRYLTDVDEEFRSYLKRKHSPAQLKKLGIVNLAELTTPEADGAGHRYLFDGARSEKVKFGEYVEFLSQRGTEYWREGGEWIRQLRKGATLNYSMSARYSKGACLIDAYALAGQHVFDCYGPQSYGAHSMRNNFDNEMHSDGEQRSVMGEFYAHQTGNPSRVERGVASSFVHGQCYFNWWWGQIFKHPPSITGGCSVWDKGRWATFARQYRKGKAISEYLAPRDTVTAGLVAQIYSGRTSSLTYGRGAIDGFGGFTSGGRQFRYTQNQQGIWESLIQSHLPVDMTWMETRTPENLRRYKVVVLADAWSVTDEEIEMLRDWVEQGGVLIVTGGSTLHDRWDRAREGYGLADVFGVDHVKTDIEGGLKNMYMYVERAIRPAKGIVTLQLTNPDYVKYAEGVQTSEHARALGHDTFEPTTAKVVGTWQDGTPAIAENRFGKGACIFLSPVYPGLSCLTVNWTVDPLHNEYWPGSRELLAACVRRALAIVATALPLEVANCPLTVETVLKKQPYHNRWVAHFLDIDPARTQVTGVEATIRPPVGQTVKAIYYPYPTRRDVEHKIMDGEMSFTVRDFSVHELVIIELDGV